MLVSKWTALVSITFCLLLCGHLYSDLSPLTASGTGYKRRNSRKNIKKNTKKKMSEKQHLLDTAFQPRDCKSGPTSMGI